MFGRETFIVRVAEDAITATESTATDNASSGSGGKSREGRGGREFDRGPGGAGGSGHEPGHGKAAGLKPPGRNAPLAPGLHALGGHGPHRPVPVNLVPLCVRQQRLFVVPAKAGIH